MLVAWLRKQITTQKLVNLRQNLLIITMTNTLLLQRLNKFSAQVFNARLAQANLIRKTDFVAKLPSLNRNITANKTKYLLVENALKKSFDSSQFVGKGHSDEEGS